MYGHAKRHWIEALNPVTRIWDRNQCFYSVPFFMAKNLWHTETRTHTHTHGRTQAPYRARLPSLKTWQWTRILHTIGTHHLASSWERIQSWALWGKYFQNLKKMWNVFFKNFPRIIPDESVLDAILSHATPGQELTFFYCLAAALSCNAGSVVRWKSYEHFQVQTPFPFFLSKPQLKPK